MSRWRLEWPSAPRRWRIGQDVDRFAWSCGDAPVRVLALDERATSALPAAAPSRIEVAVGLRLAVHWLLQPPVGLRSLAELRALAAAQCAQRHGGLSADWLVVAHWDARRPFVAVGLPVAAIARLTDRIHQPAAHWCWHTPWSLTAQRDRRPGWHGLVSPTRLLVWRRARSGVVGLADSAIPPDASPLDIDATASVLMERWHTLHGGNPQPLRWHSTLRPQTDECLWTWECLTAHHPMTTQPAAP